MITTTSLFLTKLRLSIFNWEKMTLSLLFIVIYYDTTNSWEKMLTICKMTITAKIITNKTIFLATRKTFHRIVTGRLTVTINSSSNSITASVAASTTTMMRTKNTKDWINRRHPEWRRRQVKTSTIRDWDVCKLPSLKSKFKIKIVKLAFRWGTIVLES